MPASYREYTNLNRAPFARLADSLAIALAGALPWSTSASAIIIVLWVLAVIPALNKAALRHAFAAPAAILPLVLFALALAGMLWADADWGERFGGLRGYLKLLVIPLAIAYFLAFDRGYRVLLAYLASVCLLLLLSWLTVLWPDLLVQLGFRTRFPVKDYIAQSGEFTLCAIALIYLALNAAAMGQWIRAVFCALLASAFVANIVYVATSRTTLLILPLLIIGLGARRFGGKGAIAVALACSLAAAAAWTTSPYLRDRTHQAGADIARYQADPTDLTGRNPSSVGLRLEFWKRSLHLISQAPVFGHGTERLSTTFRSVDISTAALPIANPHNQYLAVTIQLGMVGLALLIATWATHLSLFGGRGLVAWCGFALVAQTMVSSLFHSHLFDFTQGWTYAFGVGVLGGMALRERLHFLGEIRGRAATAPTSRTESSVPIAARARNDDPSVAGLKIAGAIVIYRPDLATLSSVLAAVAPQVSRLLLIANDGVAPALALPSNVELLVQDRNVGLGKAYNLAANWARASGATHLVLLDQDSVPERNMVMMLGETLSARGDVAAAGPLWRDARTGETGHFVRLTRWGARKVRPSNDAVIPVDFLISSGAVISLEAIDQIGPFDELLFIEHVDTDWCLRARAMGCTLLGVANARLDHRFGDATLTTPLFGGGQRLFLYPAERQYYLVRNSIVLWHRPYAPIGWILHDMLRTVTLVCWHVLFVPPRWARLKSVWRGICDGLDATRTRT